ncbi:hypothetical protein [Marinospirillum perlucidum]|uniref:hypothetical protein n=1 Tax=Marinospirillum perlucidum TaxID=1982602 RepID=UPI000DF19E03|nr:hypothetical protein [Marinospirillum perlucidum]
MADKNADVHRLEVQLQDKQTQLDSYIQRNPESLMKLLAESIEKTSREIAELRADEADNELLIQQKENQLHRVQVQMTEIADSIQVTTLDCPTCGLPLINRKFHPVDGYLAGHRIELESEYVEYQCGLALKDGVVVSPCRG